MIAQDIINELQLPESIKEIICKQECDRLKIIYELLLKGEISITNDKMLELAIIDGNKELFYIIVDGMEKNRLSRDMVNFYHICVENGRLEELNYLIGKYTIYHYSYMYLAKDAAYHGHMNIVEAMIEGGADDIDNIILNSIKGGCVKITLDLIERYHKDIDLYNIVYYASMYKHSDIVFNIMSCYIDRDYILWNTIATGSCRGNYRKLIDFSIGKGANEWNDMALNAAVGGHIDIVNEMIGRGASNCEGIAICSARYGHLELVKAMLGRGVTNFREIINSALDNGRDNIYKYMMDNVNII